MGKLDLDFLFESSVKMHQSQLLVLTFFADWLERNDMNSLFRDTI